MTFSIQNFEHEKILLLLTESRDLKITHMHVVKEMTRRRYHLVLITATLPYSVLSKVYDREGIDMRMIRVIDLVTLYSGGSISVPGTACRFLPNPGNLTSIGIAVTDILNEVSGSKVCLVFDEVSTMLLYAPSITISKFFHFLSSKLRIRDDNGIFLAVERGIDPTLLAQLSTFVDRVVPSSE